MKGAAVEPVSVRIRFYAELNDFLPAARAGREFEYAFAGRTSVKDLVERLGVPHTEVDLLLVNGEPAPFSQVVQDGDRISVYPVFEAFDIGSVSKVRPEPLREVRFIADTHLGKLASYLRLLGFDTAYANELDDDALAAIAIAERRAVLTRDRGLLKRACIDHGYCLRSDQPREQVVEVLQRFQLLRLVQPFARCLRCNACLEPVAKEAIRHRLAPKTLRYYDEFRLCPGCDRVYWRGSHYEGLAPLIDGILERARRLPGEQEP